MPDITPTHINKENTIIHSIKSLNKVANLPAEIFVQINAAISIVHDSIKNPPIGLLFTTVDSRVIITIAKMVFLDVRFNEYPLKNNNIGRNAKNVYFIVIMV